MDIFDTISIERSLLCTLFKSKMIVQLCLHRVNREWFTSDERRFLFDLMLRKYNESKAMLTTSVVDYEVNKNVAETSRTFYLEEWGLIRATNAEEEFELLIDLLNEAYVGKQSMELIHDIHNMIERGDVNKAVQSLKRGAVQIGTSHETKPTTEIVDYERRIKELRDRRDYPELYAGFKTGIAGYDDRTQGFFRGEMVLVSSVTGVGKSTFLKAIASRLISRGHNVLHVTNEENHRQVEMKYDALLSGIDYLDLKGAEKMDELRIKELEDAIENVKTWRGRLFIKEIPQFTTAAEIERTYYELEQQGITIDVIILDYLDHLAPIEKAWSDNDEQAKAAADCKGVAMNLDVCLLTATQAATIMEKKQEKNQRFGKMDVYGSKRKIHPTNVFMGVRMTGVIEESSEFEWKRDRTWTVDILKNRDGPPCSFDLIHRVATGLIEVDPKSVKYKNPTEVVGDLEDEDAVLDGESETFESDTVEEHVVKSIKKAKKAQVVDAPKGSEYTQKLGKINPQDKKSG